MWRDLISESKWAGDCETVSD